MLYITNIQISTGHQQSPILFCKICFPHSVFPPSMAANRGETIEFERVYRTFAALRTPCKRCLSRVSTRSTVMCKRNQFWIFFCGKWFKNVNVYSDSEQCWDIWIHTKDITTNFLQVRKISLCVFLRYFYRSE